MKKETKKLINKKNRLIAKIAINLVEAYLLENKSDFPFKKEQITDVDLVRVAIKGIKTGLKISLRKSENEQERKS